MQKDIIRRWQSEKDLRRYTEPDRGFCGYDRRGKGAFVLLYHINTVPDRSGAHDYQAFRRLKNAVDLKRVEN